MSDLSDDARNLLHLSRGMGDPDAAAFSRVRSPLLAKVAAGAALSASAGLAKTANAAASAPAAGIPTAAAGASSVTLATIAKGTLVVALIGGSAAAVHLHGVGTPQRVINVAPSAHGLASAPTTSTPPLAAPADRDASEAPVVAVDDLPSTPTPRRSMAQGAPSPATSFESTLPSEAPASLSLAGDLERLRAAERALAEDRPADALAIADTMTAKGPLAQERDGIRALARCSLARRASGATREEPTRHARAQSEHFLRAYPGASLSARVRAACHEFD